jgi:hypothetical protein
MMVALAYSNDGATIGLKGIIDFYAIITEA